MDAGSPSFVLSALLSRRCRRCWTVVACPCLCWVVTCPSSVVNGRGEPTAGGFGREDEDLWNFLFCVPIRTQKGGRDGCWSAKWSRPVPRDQSLLLTPDRHRDRDRESERDELMTDPPRSKCLSRANASEWCNHSQMLTRDRRGRRQRGGSCATCAFPASTVLSMCCSHDPEMVRKVVVRATVSPRRYWSFALSLEAGSTRL